MNSPALRASDKRSYPRRGPRQTRPRSSIGGRRSHGVASYTAPTDGGATTSQKWTKVWRNPVSPLDEPYFGSSPKASFQIPMWVRLDDLTAEERAIYDEHQRKKEVEREKWKKDMERALEEKDREAREKAEEEQRKLQLEEEEKASMLENQPAVDTPENMDWIEDQELASVENTEANEGKADPTDHRTALEGDTAATAPQEIEHEVANADTGNIDKSSSESASASKESGEEQTQNNNDVKVSQMETIQDVAHGSRDKVDSHNISREGNDASIAPAEGATEEPTKITIQGDHQSIPDSTEASNAATSNGEVKESNAADFPDNQTLSTQTQKRALDQAMSSEMLNAKRDGEGDDEVCQPLHKKQRQLEQEVQQQVETEPRVESTNVMEKNTIALDAPSEDQPARLEETTIEVDDTFADNAVSGSTETVDQGANSENGWKS